MGICEKKSQKIENLNEMYKDNNIILFTSLYFSTAQKKDNTDKLIKAVIKQNKTFLKKNFNSENINRTYDFPVTNTINVYLHDGT